ncbi:putative acyltransferase with acyl-CoA N-acyltransferase domain [Escherichia coli K-12]|nr:putative acyltransferase with acyl-CoA N-acyltransferase domain [Escherichia coli K-12]
MNGKICITLNYRFPSFMPYYNCVARCLLSSRIALIRISMVMIGDNRHILGWKNDELVAYARILKSDDDLEPVVIGRVIVSEALRGEKVGQQLMSKTLETCTHHWPDKPVYLGAQAHLQNFYQSFGFIPVTEVYEEDGIPHIGMAREVIQA